MNILVCLKQVPDSAATIRLRTDGTGIDEAGVKWVVNPFDEFAVEEAVRLKETRGEVTITLVSLGPQRVQEALRTALAMGADRAVHMDDPALEGQDNLATARVLAAVAQEENYALILAGQHATDDGCGQTPAALAEYLGWPQIPAVTRLEVAEEGRSVVAHRRIEGAEEVIEAPLPAVISCEKGLNEPRYPSLPNLMKAKRKEMAPRTLVDLNLDPATVGRGGSFTRVTGYARPPARSGARLLNGGGVQAAAELVRCLREEGLI